MELSDSGDSDGELSEEPQRPEEPGALARSPVTEAATTEVTDASKSNPKPSVLHRVMGMLSASRPLPHTQSLSEPGTPAPPPPPPRAKSSKQHHWKSPVHHPGAAPIAAAAAAAATPKGGRKFRRADTNIVSLRFDTLKKPSTMHAGEVIQCSSCEAIMSNISKIEDDGPDKVWKCEFCGNRNLVDIEEEEKPGADDVTYLIEAALSTTAIGSSGRDESIVVFCIDVSGSMTITTEVPGHQKLRGSATLRRLRRENTMEGMQRLPSEARNITYISRLQAVQAAVDHQLGEMAREFPHRRVALITFSSEVSVIGDGTGEVVTVSGQKLTDREELSKVGSELTLPRSIREVRASLGEKIFGLEEGGATALGPAIIVALSLASRQPGSKVILCTDGKSNEGVGKVENLQETDPAPDDFYEDIAATANSKGVLVSVVTISGTDCKLIQLGKLANNTGGQVNIVDPLKLTEEFSNVLADRIIATSVVATFIVHKDLYIGKEENAAFREQREIGNVNSDHEISFEFGLRRRKTKDQAAKPNPLDRISEVSTSVEDKAASSRPSSSDNDGKTEAAMDTGTDMPSGSGTGEGGASAQEERSKAADDIPSEVPFQVQITYTDVDGTKALRVLTQKKPVTRDREVAERDVDLNVLALHTERRSSELALMGDYTASRGVALMNQRLGWRSSHNSTDESRRKMYRRVFSRVQTVENTVSDKQKQELRTYGRTHSDDEEEEEEEDSKELMDSAALAPSNPTAQSSYMNTSPGAASRPAQKKKMKLRSEEVDDSMANVLYQARGPSSPAYWKSRDDKNPKK